MNMPSAAPRGTTLVSPVAMGTPAARAASAMEATMRASSSMGKPSSRMNAALSARGDAPLMERSLMVPWTASFPISPPGKNSGVTTNESVVKAMRAAPASSTAWSSSRLSRGLSKAGRKISRMSWALSLPPLPCPSTTVLRSAMGSGQESVKSVICAVRSCSTPRKRPRRRPWWLPAAFRACIDSRRRGNREDGGRPAAPGR